METTEMSSAPATSEAPVPFAFEFETFDNAHHVPLIVFGSLSAFLSLLGSGCVLAMTWRKVRTSIMDRLLMGLSLSDLTSSTGNLIMFWMLPEELNLAGANGDYATCSAAGFMLMTGNLAGCIFNAYLSVYFFLVVRRSYKERDFNRWLELSAYFFGVIAPLSLNLAALATKSINPSPLFNSVCTYATYPWTCNDNDELECQRSSRAEVNPIVYVGFFILLLFTLLGFACTFLVACTVRSTLLRSRRYRFNGDRDEGEGDCIRQVSIQAVLYSLAYLNTFLWPFLGAVLSSQLVYTAIEIQEVKLTTRYYALQVLYWMLYPLQGFLNFLIYTRNKYKSWRKAEPDVSLFRIYQLILSDTPLPHRKSTHVVSSTYHQSRKSHHVEDDVAELSA